MLELWQVFIFIFFGLSLIANIALALYIRRLSKSPGEKTYDVHNLLQDLLNGAGLVKIERIDPADVLLRSPRFRQ